MDFPAASAEASCSVIPPWLQVTADIFDTLRGRATKDTKGHRR